MADGDVLGGLAKFERELVHVEKPASPGFIDQVTCERCGMSYSRGVPESTDETVAFLLLDREKQAVIGACRFRWPEYTDVKPWWAMQWIWIAPTHRRHGVLTRHWPIFIEKFQAFYAERPLADAMQAFLDKLGDPWPKQATAELAPQPV